MLDYRKSKDLRNYFMTYSGSMKIIRVTIIQRIHKCHLASSNQTIARSKSNSANMLINLITISRTQNYYSLPRISSEES